MASAIVYDASASEEEDLSVVISIDSSEGAASILGSVENIRNEARQSREVGGAVLAPNNFRCLRVSFCRNSIRERLLSGVPGPVVNPIDAPSAIALLSSTFESSDESSTEDCESSDDEWLKGLLAKTTKLPASNYQDSSEESEVSVCSEIVEDKESHDIEWLQDLLSRRKVGDSKDDSHKPLVNANAFDEEKIFDECEEDGSDAGRREPRSDDNAGFGDRAWLNAIVPPKQDKIDRRPGFMLSTSSSSDSTESLFSLSGCSETEYQDARSSPDLSEENKVTFSDDCIENEKTAHTGQRTESTNGNDNSESEHSGSSDETRYFDTRSWSDVAKSNSLNTDDGWNSDRSFDSQERGSEDQFPRTPSSSALLSALRPLGPEPNNISKDASSEAPKSLFLASNDESTFVGEMQELDKRSSNLQFSECSAPMNIKSRNPSSHDEIARSMIVNLEKPSSEDQIMDSCSSRQTCDRFLNPSSGLGAPNASLNDGTAESGDDLDDEEGESHSFAIILFVGDSQFVQESLAAGAILDCDSFCNGLPSSAAENKSKQLRSIVATPPPLPDSCPGGIRCTGSTIVEKECQVCEKERNDLAPGTSRGRNESLRNTSNAIDSVEHKCSLRQRDLESHLCQQSENEAVSADSSFETDVATTDTTAYEILSQLSDFSTDKEKMSSAAARREDASCEIKSVEEKVQVESLRNNALHNGAYTASTFNDRESGVDGARHIGEVDNELCDAFSSLFNEGEKCLKQEDPDELCRVSAADSGQYLLCRNELTEPLGDSVQVTGNQNGLPQSKFGVNISETSKTCTESSQFPVNMQHKNHNKEPHLLKMPPCDSAPKEYHLLTNVGLVAETETSLRSEKVVRFQIPDERVNAPPSQKSKEEHVLPTVLHMISCATNSGDDSFCSSQSSGDTPESESARGSLDDYDIQEICESLMSAGTASDIESVQGNHGMAMNAVGQAISVGDTLRSALLISEREPSDIRNPEIQPLDSLTVKTVEVSFGRENEVRAMNEENGGLVGSTMGGSAHKSIAVEIDEKKLLDHVISDRASHAPEVRDVSQHTSTADDSSDVGVLSVDNSVKHTSVKLRRYAVICLFLVAVVVGITAGLALGLRSNGSASTKPSSFCDKPTEERGGSIYMTLKGLERTLNTTEQTHLEQALVEVYNDVSHGCDDLFHRFALHASLLQQDLVVLDNGKNVATRWGLNLVCHNCPATEPLFAAKDVIEHPPEDLSHPKTRRLGSPNLSSRNLANAELSDVNTVDPFVFFFQCNENFQSLRDIGVIGVGYDGIGLAGIIENDGTEVAVLEGATSPPTLAPSPSLTFLPSLSPSGVSSQDSTPALSIGLATMGPTSAASAAANSPDSFVTIRSGAMFQTLCAEIPDSNVTGGIHITLGECAARSNQLWHLDDEGYIHSYLDYDMCMAVDIEAAVAMNGAVVFLAGCNKRKSNVQEWEWNDVGQIRLKGRNLCIDGNFKGSIIYTWECSVSKDQIWLR